MARVTRRRTSICRGSSAIVVFTAAALFLSCGRATTTTRRTPDSQSPAVESDDAGPRTRRPEDRPHPVIWLGLDGIDWEILDRLSSEGKMPNWSRLVSEGYSSRLKSFMPLLSPIIWNTVATGVGPDVHRVLDFQEVDPKTGQKVPISGFSRAVPAIWNTASAAGKTVGVVGWWATHPAEEVNGFFISDHASPILYEKLSLSGVAYPASFGSFVGQVVAREGRATPNDLSRFIDVPPAEIARALASGEGMQNQIVALDRILSATRVYQRIGRKLYDNNLPDLMMIYLEGTDEIGHVFAPFTPPRLECVSDQDFSRYHRAVEVYYGVIDQMLGQWMRRAAEDHATLIVNSDHGFKWGEDRSCARSSLNWSTAAYWHRFDGVFAAWGERVKPGKSSQEPSMFDVAPTVLALLDLPQDRRMSGKPIGAGFDGLGPGVHKDVFATLTVRRVPAAAMSATEANEYTKKLLALGYLSGSEVKAVAPTGGDRPGMTEGAWNNLGLYYRETVHNAAAAKEAFEKSLELSPEYHSPMFNLAILYRSQGDDERARQWLFRSFAAGHAEPERTLATWIEWYDDNRPQKALPLLEQAVASFPENEAFTRALAIARFKRRDCSGAYAALAPFESKTSDPDTLNSLALLQTCLGRRQEAIALLERSLAIKPDQPGAIKSLNVLKGGYPPKG
jgi:predicted AlkP superfamily phosphohydrolase/phosphomutase/thioredoxin-like negative regulator of GroEL